MGVDLDVNIRGHNEQYLRSLTEASAATEAFRRQQDRANRSAARDEERALREEQRQHERTQRSFLAGLAPGGRRATGVAGLLGAVTGGTLAASPIAGSTLSALSTMPALAAGIAPLVGTLPAIGVGALGAAEGVGVLKVATDGLMKVISADTPQKLASALKGLDKPTQKLAYAFHQELHPALQRLQDLAQKTVLPSLFKLGYEFTQLAKPKGAIFDGMEAAGKSVGKVINSITNLLSDKAFQKQLDHLLVGVGDGIAKLVKILPPMLDMFVRVENLALPFASRIGDAIGHWADKADDFVQGHGKQITQFFDQAFKTAQAWLHGIGDVAGIFFGLSRAASGLSTALGTGITHFLDQINTFVNSKDGQKALRGFFANALPTLQSFGSLVKNLLGDLGKLAANPATQEFIQTLFNDLRIYVLPILNAVAEKIPGIAHELAPALDILGKFALESLKPLVDAMMTLITNLIPPLIPLLTNIAEILRLPLQELTSIVDLLSQALGQLGKFSAGGSGGAGIGELLALGFLMKKGPGLLTKVLGTTGLRAEAKVAVPTAEKLGSTAILAALGSAEARDGFVKVGRMAGGVAAGAGTYAGSIAVEGAAGAATTERAVDAALAYLQRKRASIRDTQMIRDSTTPASEALRTGRLRGPVLDSAGNIIPEGVVRRLPIARTNLGYIGRPSPTAVDMGLGQYGPTRKLYGAAADPATYFKSAKIPAGVADAYASPASRAAAYEAFRSGNLNMAPFTMKERLGDIGKMADGKIGAGLDKAFESLKKFGKIFAMVQAGLAALDGLDKASHTNGGILAKAGAFGSTAIKDLAAPLVQGPWWSRIGAGALAGASVGGLPGAAVGVGVEAGSLLSDHVGGHIADFAGKNALQAKDIQQSIKNWNLAAVPAKLHQAILDSYESSNKEGFAKFAASVQTALGRLPALVKGMSPAFVKAFLSPIAGAASQAGSVLDNLAAGVSQSMHIIQTDMGTKSRAGRNAMVAAFEETKMQIQQAMAAGLVSVSKGSAAIKAEMVSILKAMGYKNVDAVAKDITSAQGKSAWQIVQASGTVPSEGGNQAGHGQRGLMTVGGDERMVGGDNVMAAFNGKPAVVANGENIAVFNRHQRAELNARLADVGGLHGFFRSRRKKHTDVPTFSTGGNFDAGFFPAPGTNYSVGQEPQIAARLDRLAHALHLHLQGISGWRSPQHSVEVGGFPNDPHTRGAASDTPGIEGVSERVLERFGLTRPFGGAAEADHIQLLGSALGKIIGGAGGGGMGKIPALKLIKALKAKGVGGMVGLEAQWALDMIRAGANKKIKSVHDSLGGTGGLSGGTSGANQALGHKMMLAMGWGENQWPALKALWTRESGWNQNARNPSSGAYGIPQALGHGNVFGSNPADQIRWGLNYIKGRYGSPVAAWAHEVGAGWYSTGTDNTDGNPGTPTIGGDLGVGIPVSQNVLNPPTGHKKKKAKAKTKKQPFSSGPGFPSFKGIKPKKLGGAKIPGIAKKLKKLSNKIDKDSVGSHLSNLLEHIQGMNEQYPNWSPTLSLYDAMSSDGGSLDLTNFLNAHPEVLRAHGVSSVAEFIDKFGNGLEVLNTTDPGNLMDLAATGLMNQGVFAPGIPEHMQFDMKQLASYKDYLAQAQVAVNGKGGYRADLEYLHATWEHYYKLRNNDQEDLNRYNSHHLTWDQKVNIDQQKIDLWDGYLKSYSESDVSHRMTNQAKLNKIHAREAIKKLKEDIAKLKKEKTPVTGPPPKKGKHESTSAYQKRLGDWNQRHRDENTKAGRMRADIQGYDNNMFVINNDTQAWNTNAGLANSYQDAINTLTGNIGTVLHDSLPALNADIKSTTGNRIMPTPIDAGSGSGSGTDTSGLKDQLNENLAASLAIANAQFNVFTGFAPMVGARLIGAFDHGGVVPRTGMALVHKGEFINPNPQGPFRNGQNAAGSATGSGDTHLELHLHGGLDGVVERAIMKHGPKIIRMTSEQQGRRTRLLSSSPGR